MITLYHNPNCSKSRETLAILRENGVNVQIIEYLKQPLDNITIQRLINESGISVRDALRSDVEEYVQFVEGNELSDAELIELMARYPRLLNRPFASGQKGTKFCRPPELVKELF